MPYASEAQRRYFHANAAKLQKQGVNIHEWDEATKGKKIPERVKPKPTFRQRVNRAFPNS